MGRGSMDWTLEDNMVDGLIFCATFTGRRGGHTPFVQAGAGTPDTGAEAVKPDPGSSWQGHSGRVGAGVVVKMRSLVVLSNHSAFHQWRAKYDQSSKLLRVRSEGHKRHWIPHYHEWLRNRAIVDIQGLGGKKKLEQLRERSKRRFLSLTSAPNTHLSVWQNFQFIWNNHLDKNATFRYYLFAAIVLLSLFESQELQHVPTIHMFLLLFFKMWIWVNSLVFLQTKHQMNH